MPASVTLRGASDTTFGIGTTISFLYLEKVDQSNDPEFIASVMDQNGITIGKAYGPTKSSSDFSGTLRGSNPAVAGNVFAYNGLNYIIEKVTLTASNNDFTKTSFSAVAYPGIPNP